MQPDPHALQISVDGSCLSHSGRRSGYAGYVQWPNGTVEEIAFRGFRESTNNRMELAACIAALKWVWEEQPRVSRVQIFSDSRYVVENIHRAPCWQANRWRNAEGRPVENGDLWKRFLTTRSKTGVPVHFGWVKGKSDPLRKTVDAAAKKAAQSGTDVDRGLIVGKIGRASTKGGSATLYPAAGQVEIIRVYASKLAGKTEENQFKFELYNEATQEFGSKHVAYAEPDIGAQLHRQRAFRVQMNVNPKYPQILAVLEEIPLKATPRSVASAKVLSISTAAKE